jgi:adenylate cyclase
MGLGLRLGILPALLVGLVAIAASTLPAVFRLEERVGLALLLTLRGPLPAPPEVVIVRIDESLARELRAAHRRPERLPARLATCASARGGLPDLRAVGLEPIPRVVYACLIDELRRRGAAVVVLDVAFLDADRAATDQLAAAITAHGRVVLLGDLVDGRTVAPAPSLTFAAFGWAIWVLDRRARPIGEFWTCFVRDGDILRPPGPVDCAPFAAGGAATLPLRAIEAAGAPALARLAELQRLDRPRAGAMTPEIAHWLAEFGPSLRSGSDGLARVRAGLTAAERNALWSLAQAAGAPPVWQAVPYGPGGTIASLGVIDLFDEHLPDAALAGRAVFVGYHELDLPPEQDRFHNAFSWPDGTPLTGVEWAATAYANIWRGERLRALPEAQRLLLLGLLGTLLTLVAMTRRRWTGALLVLGHVTAYGGIAVAVFMTAQLWLPVIVPMALAPLAMIVAEVARNPTFRGGRAIGFAGTILITDVVGSTGRQRRLGEAAWKAVLERHYELLERAVERERGRIYAFTGDGIVAAFGRPTGCGDDAESALRAATAVVEALAGLDERGGGVPIRVGVHSGPAQVVTVGAGRDQRLTVVGDAVNEAKRAEEAGKAVGATSGPVVVVSEATRRRLAAPWRLADLGERRLRGVEAPLRLWRLVGPPGTGRAAEPMIEPAVEKAGSPPSRDIAKSP